MNYEAIETQKIIEKVRQSLAPKRHFAVPPAPTSPPTDASYSHSGDPTVPAIEEIEGIEDLEILQTGFDIYHVPIKAHSRAFAPVTIFLRKLVRKLMRPVIEQQVVYNAANSRLSRSLRDYLVRYLNRYRQSIQEFFQTVGSQLDALHQAQRALHTFMEEIRDHINVRFEQITDSTIILRSEFDQLQALQHTQAQLLEQIQREIAQIQAHQMQVEATQQSQYTEFEHLLDRLQQLAHQGQATHEQVARAERKMRVLMQEGGRGSLPSTDREQSPGMGHPIAAVSSETLSCNGLSARQFPALDYAGFMERFWGSEAAVKAVYQGYVAHFQAAAPVLDLACGRGEFLELLREAGQVAQGIEVNGDLVLLCRDKGLDVQQGEPIAYLERVESQSLGGIFAARLLESLHPQEVAGLLHHCYDKLQRGGTIALELMNPMDAETLSASYGLDPSHLRWFHPATIAYLLETAGFTDVQSRDVPFPCAQPRPERHTLITGRRWG